MAKLEVGVGVGRTDDGRGEVGRVDSRRWEWKYIGRTDDRRVDCRRWEWKWEGQMAEGESGSGKN